MMYIFVIQHETNTDFICGGSTVGVEDAGRGMVQLKWGRWGVSFHSFGRGFFLSNESISVFGVRIRIVGRHFWAVSGENGAVYSSLFSIVIWCTPLTKLFALGKRCSHLSIVIVHCSLFFC